MAKRKRESQGSSAGVDSGAKKPDENPEQESSASAVGRERKRRKLSSTKSSDPVSGRFCLLTYFNILFFSTFAFYFRITILSVSLFLLLPTLVVVQLVKLLVVSACTNYF